jgi:ABC-2 type transport system ATP-binding protein
MTAAIEAHGVAKRYGSVAALEDLSCAVEQGEILGVLGPNGAGKTTAIRVLTTILAPSAGHFAIAGVPHTRPTEIRRRIGVLPESAGYPRRLTGEEYLRYFARLYGHSRSSARALASELLEVVGLADRARSLVAAYSRGMCQRLGLARALLNDPGVVFLDEPTLGLDPAGQRQVLVLVRHLAHERGATVLLCTHLLAEVEDVATRVLILNHGRVVSAGTVAEIVRDAAEPRTARLLVDAQRVEQAARAVAGTRGVAHVERANGQPGRLTITLGPERQRAAEETVADGLHAVLAAQIPVLSFELERARLSDAFLAMTEGE